MGKVKIIKLIRKYSKVMGLDEKTVTKVFFKDHDIMRMKRDLIAMRASIYAKKHITADMNYLQQQEEMEKFTKTENLKDVKWPKIKVQYENTDKKTV